MSKGETYASIMIMTYFLTWKPSRAVSSLSFLRSCVQTDKHIIIYSVNVTLNLYQGSFAVPINRLLSRLTLMISNSWMASFSVSLSYLISFAIIFFLVFLSMHLLMTAYLPLNHKQLTLLKIIRDYYYIIIIQ